MYRLWLSFRIYVLTVLCYSIKFTIMERGTFCGVTYSKLHIKQLCHQLFISLWSITHTSAFSTVDSVADLKLTVSNCFKTDNGLIFLPLIISESFVTGNLRKSARFCQLCNSNLSVVHFCFGIIHKFTTVKEEGMTTFRLIILIVFTEAINHGKKEKRCLRYVHVYICKYIKYCWALYLIQFITICDSGAMWAQPPPDGRIKNTTDYFVTSQVAVVLGSEQRFVFCLAVANLALKGGH